MRAARAARSATPQPVVKPAAGQRATPSRQGTRSRRASNAGSVSSKTPEPRKARSRSPSVSAGAGVTPKARSRSSSVAGPAAGGVTPKARSRSPSVSHGTSPQAHTRPRSRRQSRIGDIISGHSEATTPAATPRNAAVTPGTTNIRSPTAAFLDVDFTFGDTSSSVPATVPHHVDEATVDDLHHEHHHHHHHHNHLHPVTLEEMSETTERVVKAYQRRESRQIEEAERLAAIGREGERRRAAATEAHERALKDRGVTLQSDLDNRAALWLRCITHALVMDAAFRTVREGHALSVLREHFQPVFHRQLCHRRKRRQHAALIAATHGAGKVPPVTPELLQEGVSGTFFREWPAALLRVLISKLQPIVFAEGEPVMHDGDFDRCMYVFCSGAYRLLVRNPVAGKRRNLATAKVRLELTAPAYLGEFAALVHEPRSATVIATSELVGFFLTVESFDEVATQLTPQLRESIATATRARRKTNLEKHGRPDAFRLQRCPAFADWDVEGRVALSEAMAADVLENGATLFRSGEVNDVMYYLVAGKVRLTTGAGQPLKRFHESAVGLHRPDVAMPGEMIGSFNAVFGRARRHETATCEGRCELFAVPFQLVTRIGMADVLRLVSSRQRMKERYAARMDVPGGALLSTPPLLERCVPPAVGRDVLELSPSAVFVDEDIYSVDTECDRIVIITRGSVTVRYRGALTALTETVEVSDEAPVTNAAQRNAAGLTLHLQRARVDLADGSRGSAPVIILGWLEFLTQSEMWLGTAVPNGACEAVVVNRRTLEDRLPPALVASLGYAAVAEKVLQLAVAHDVDALAQYQFLSPAALECLQKRGRARASSIKPGARGGTAAKAAAAGRATPAVSSKAAAGAAAKGPKSTTPSLPEPAPQSRPPTRSHPARVATAAKVTGRAPTGRGTPSAKLPPLKPGAGAGRSTAAASGGPGSTQRTRYR